MPQDPLTFAVILFELAMMVLSISLHDMAQAWTANRLGDPTGRMLGRISLSPVPHFDPWGMGLSPLLSLFFFHNPLPLGWGKPVPMTYANFRSKNGEMLAVLAGPATQMLAAIVALIILILLKHHAAGAADSLVLAQALAFHIPVVGLSALPSVFPVLLLLYLCIMMNLLLLCLNLLPMPFFDGGRVLLHFLPYNAARIYEQSTTWFLIAFFLLARPLIMIAFSPLLSIFDAFLFHL